MMNRLRDLFDRAQNWPQQAQEQLAEIALEIEISLRPEYRATSDELQAIDEADASGIATAEEVAAAYRAFRSE